VGLAVLRRDRPAGSGARSLPMRTRRVPAGRNYRGRAQEAGRVTEIDHNKCGATVILLSGNGAWLLRTRSQSGLPKDRHGASQHRTRLSNESDESDFETRTAALMPRRLQALRKATGRVNVGIIAPLRGMAGILVRVRTEWTTS
jgi:hypothetical protein